MVKGITKRWMINTLSVILSIIILIVVILIFSITHLFQSRVEQDLHSASNELSMVFSGFKADNPTDFTSLSRDYIENFDKKEQMGVMVLNTSGRVVLTSTGFIPSEDEKMTDFDEAKQSASGYAFWNGKLLSGERAMSETRIICDENNNVIGALRYIVSMEPAHSRTLLFSEDPLCGHLQSVLDDDSLRPVPFNPTAENMAAHLGTALFPEAMARAGMEGVAVAAVTVYETDTSWATWSAE